MRRTLGIWILLVQNCLASPSYGQHTDSIRAVTGISQDTFWIMRENMPKNKVWGNSWHLTTGYTWSKRHEFDVNVGRTYGSDFCSGGGCEYQAYSWGMGYGIGFRNHRANHLLKAYVEHTFTYYLISYSLRMEYLSDITERSHYLRPAVGCSFVRLDLVYNYSFRLNRNENLFKHGVTLRYKLFLHRKNWYHKYPDRYKATSMTTSGHEHRLREPFHLPLSGHAGRILPGCWQTNFYPTIRVLMYSFLICVASLATLSCGMKNDGTDDVDKQASDTTRLDMHAHAYRLDTLLNMRDYLILGNKPAKVMVVSDKEVDNFPTFEILAGYRDDVIIGENTDYDSLELYRKYHPNSSFEDYPADLYSGTLAEPDFSTDPNARDFKTRILEECAGGANFAGHYTLVIWGCGSPCQSGVLVDRKTGRIHGGYGTALSAAFRKDSRMIIRNVEAIDTTTNLIRICPYCEVNHEIWTGSSFQEVE